MKVTIRGDSIKVNDKETGKLRPGDSVLIGDEGVAVNELDYGETEKYLRANSSEQTTAHESIRKSFWSALTCQRFGPWRPVATVIFETRFVCAHHWLRQAQPT